MTEANRDDLKVTLDDIRRTIEAHKAAKRAKRKKENVAILLLTLAAIAGIFVASQL